MASIKNNNPYSNISVTVYVTPENTIGLAIQTNVICPVCNKTDLAAYCNDSFVGHYVKRLHCRKCQNITPDSPINITALRTANNFVSNWENRCLTESQMALNIYYEHTHNNSIVEMSLSVDKKGEWKQYAEPFLNIIKAMIPISHREYDGVTKTWQIAASYFPALSMAANGLKSQGSPVNLKEVVKGQSAANPFSKPVDKAYEENFFYEEPAPTSSAPSKESISVQLGNLLGITISSQSMDELKRIYRKKALELHPDRNNGDGSKMSELNSLWSVYSR